MNMTIQIKYYDVLSITGEKIETSENQLFLRFTFI